jgi:hypothetical protein
MPKGASKIREIRKIMGGNDINGLFEEMTGVKDADENIIKPKIAQTRNIFMHIYKVLKQFSTHKEFRNSFPYTETGLNEIGEYADKIKENIIVKEQNREETADDYANLNKEQANSLYRTIKNNKYTKQLIALSGKLYRYKNNLADSKNLDGSFINQEPGLSFRIFDFSSFDLKQLWCDDKLSAMGKKYILHFLYVISKDTFNLYKIVTSPDIDIKKFASILMESLDHLSSQAELSRCKGAFNRIRKSITLLEEKFDTYYRESIAGSNPNIIVENFILDVSNQGGASPQLTREFRMIIQYMRKVSMKNGKHKDPNVQKLFGMLNQNFNIMEQNAKPQNSNIDNTVTNIEKVDLSLKKDSQ